MSRLHHEPEHHDAALPEELERHQLIVRCNDLAHTVREQADLIAQLRAELAHTQR